MTRLNRQDCVKILEENKILKAHNEELITFYHRMVLTKLPMRVGQDLIEVECMVSKETKEKLDAIALKIKEAIDAAKKEEAKESKDPDITPSTPELKSE